MLGQLSCNLDGGGEEVRFRPSTLDQNKLQIMYRLEFKAKQRREGVKQGKKKKKGEKEGRMEEGQAGRRE